MATWYEKLEQWIESRGGCRYIYRPDENGNPVLYLKRYYVLRTPWCEIMLHQFFLGDEGPVHDHPFPSWGAIIATGYIEHICKLMRGPGQALVVVQETRKPGDWSSRPAASADHSLATSFHKVELLPGTSGKVHTLFVTGPRTDYSWGFADPQKGFVDYRVQFSKDGTGKAQSAPNQWGYGLFPRKKVA